MKPANLSGQSDKIFSKRKQNKTEVLLEKRTRILEGLLARGDFREANEKFGQLLQNVDYLKLPLNNIWRAKATAISAGIYFYRGDIPAAWRALNEYISHEGLFLSMTELRTGQKLVLAEYAYSRGEFEVAIKIANKILDECEVEADLSGAGAVCHFISRCYRRLHKYEELRRFSERTRECFLQLFLRSEKAMRPETVLENLMVLRWRIGLSCLIEGYSLWSRGDIASGRHKLITAKALLENTGDFIGEANVLQSLGSIARSEGNFEVSLENFNRALELYNESGHHLNISRTLTNIARTYLRTADQCVGDREKAKEKLEEALEICKSHNQTRQMGEVLVILSWLYLHQGDPARAEACASEALKHAKSVDSPGLQAEARMSLGYCRYQKNDKDAIGELKAALQCAKTLKLQVSAHLALAEVFSGTNKIYEAIQHLREAQSMLEPESNISSVYLTQKYESVRKQINELKSDYFLVTFDTVKNQAKRKSKPRGLSKATKDLERWAIVKALEQSDGITQAAEMLGLARQAFWQRKKRARLNSNTTS